MITPKVARICKPNWLTVRLQRIFWLPALCLSTTVAARGQCAMCRTAIANSADGAALARGLNLEILFLLAIPMLLVGSISFLIRRSHRQLRGTTEATDDLGRPPIEAQCHRMTGDVA